MRVLGGVTLLAIAATAAVLVFLLAGSGGSGNNDPHGYVGIFSVVGLVVLLLPTMFLVTAAGDLRRHKRGGFVLGAAGGGLLLFLGSLLSQPATFGLAALGLALLVTGILGFVQTRQRAPSEQ